MKRRREVGFAPSSGACITCKQRKIRCDQTQPSCEKCIRSGRLCLGYRNPSVAFDFESSTTSQMVEDRSLYTQTETDVRSIKSISPLHIARGPPLRYASLCLKEAERHTFEYFTSVFCDMVIAATPAIDSDGVVLALSRDKDLLSNAASLIGTAYRASTRVTPPSLAATTSSAIKTNLSRQYRRTITGLRDLITNARNETLESILVACLFLSILELVRGNNVQALRHLSFGRVIFMEHYPRTLGLAVPDEESLAGSPLIQLLIGTFFPFGVHPSMGKQTLAIGSKAPEPYHFRSIEDATYAFNALQDSSILLVADLIDLAEEYRCSVAPETALLSDSKQFCLTTCVSRMSTVPVTQRISDRLDELRQSHRDWNKGYQLLVDNAEPRTAELLLLQIRWYTSYLKLQLCRDSNDMAIDRFTPDLWELLELLELYLTTWKQQGKESSPEPSIPNHITHVQHTEIGALQALVTVCIKCRDPTIRHRALRLLSTAKRQESLHDSDVLAVLVKSVIILEEDTTRVEWRFGSLAASEAPPKSIPYFARFSEVGFDQVSTEGATKVLCVRRRVEFDGAIELLEFDYWGDETIVSGLHYDQDDRIDAEIERSIRASTLRLCSREVFPGLVEPVWAREVVELPSR